jgi:uncharacterized protein with ParB-like and HNH nuclease domain
MSRNSEANPTDQVSGLHLIEWDSDTTDTYHFTRLIDPVVEEQVSPQMLSVYELLKNYEFSIPEYQRGFAWDETNVSQFWDDLREILETDYKRNSLNDRFMGSVFLVRPPGSKGGIKMHIIDGQQRITIFYILVKLLIHELESIDATQIESDDVKSKLESYIRGMEQLIITGFSSEPGLELGKHDNEFFKALFGTSEDKIEFIQNREKAVWNKQKDAIKPEKYFQMLEIEADVERNRSFPETNMLLLRSYVTLRDNIREVVNERKPDSQAILLLNLAGYFLHNFQLSVFEIPNNYPTLMMRVFQSLNDRGANLAEVDIIRARIGYTLAGDEYPVDRDALMKKYEEVVDELWGNKDIIVDYLVEFILVMRDVPTSYTRGDVAKYLMSAFSNTQIAESQRLDDELADPRKAKQFIEELHTHVGSYRSIRAASDKKLDGLDDSVASDVHLIIHRLSELNTSQWRALLFKAYTIAKDSSSRIQDSFVDICLTVESITYRQLMLGLSPNKMEVVYQSGIESLRDDNIADVRDKLIESFEEQYPNAMGESFARSLISNIEPTDKHIKSLYWRISAKPDKNDQMFQETLDISNIHYEHILPKKPILNDRAYDRYAWFKSFFGDVVEGSFQSFLDNSIQSGADDILKKLCDATVTSDYGNTCLLLDNINQKIKNKPFDVKLPNYKLTHGFDRVKSNVVLSDSRWPEGLDELTKLARLENLDTKEKLPGELNHFLREFGFSEQDFRRGKSEVLNEIKQESAIREASNAVRGSWTFDLLIQRKIDLTNIIFEEISLIEGEFAEFETEREVKQNMDRRIKMFVAGHEDRVN